MGVTLKKMIVGKIVSRTRLNVLKSYFNLNFCRKCHNSKELKTETKNEIKIDNPEEPTTCCMSGCANCVWLEYAQKLSECYKDGGQKALQEIEEKVADPNVKAFLLHELRMMEKKT